MKKYLFIITVCLAVASLLFILPSIAWGCEWSFVNGCFFVKVYTIPISVLALTSGIIYRRSANSFFGVLGIILGILSFVPYFFV